MAGNSLFREPARHSLIFEFHSCALYHEVLHCELFVKILFLSLKRKIGLFQMLTHTHDQMRIRAKKNLKNVRLEMFESSRFLTTEWWSSPTIALALPMLVLILMFCILSVVNNNFSGWATGTSRPSDLYCHFLAANTDLRFWRDIISCFFFNLLPELTILPELSKQLILLLPTVTPSWSGLSLPMYFMYTMIRGDDSTHSCHKLLSTTTVPCQ